MAKVPSINVEKSVMQARWVLAKPDDEYIQEVMREHELPELLARLISIRDIEQDEVESFITPTLAKDFPDPSTLKDMDVMADFIADKVMAGEVFGIIGDFDVDGATSTAILARFLRQLGCMVDIYIPDRLEEGYGPNVKAFDTLKDKGCGTVFICDCGVTAHDIIAEGKSKGLDIIVLDHHEAEDTLPPANFIIDPKRKDDESGLDMLAACGVVFLACVAINAALRKKDFFQNGNAEPSLKDMLDVVALGTVCDMVPLTGANRLFVKQGLTIMQNTSNIGLRQLMDVSGLEGAPDTYHMGFILGPRINAGSRVHKSDLGAKLLSTDNAEEAKNIAWTLNDCNKKRKDIQEEMAIAAINMVEDQGLSDNDIIMVGDEAWHPGLSGLVAGRLREKYDKPAICITYATGTEHEVEGRGSGRSVPGINLGAAFIDARHEGFLLKGGGHAMAAGFTVLPDKINQFYEFLSAHVQKQKAGQEFVTESHIDSIGTVRGMSVSLVKKMQEVLGPFGQSNEEPLFLLPNVKIQQADIIGTDHVKCMLTDWEGGTRMKSIAFRAHGTPLGDLLLNTRFDTPVHLVGYFKINNWQGRESVEMHIHDAAPVIIDSSDSVSAA